VKRQVTHRRRISDCILTERDCQGQQQCGIHHLGPRVGILTIGCRPTQPQFLLEYLLTDIPNYGLLSPVPIRRPLRRWIPISCYQCEYSFVIISATTKRFTKHLPVLAVSTQVLHFSTPFSSVLRLLCSCE